MDWKERLEDFWDGFKDRGYYIAGIVILILVPFILRAPAAKLPEPFSILNNFFNGKFLFLDQLPVLPEIYALGRSGGVFPSNDYVLRILTLCAIWAIFAASWDLLSGYTGQINFGHAVFWGLAAYFSYWFSSGMEVGVLKPLLGDYYVADPLTAMLLGGLVAALLALIIGVIALRVKGPNLALVTLMLPLIVGRLPAIINYLDIGIEGELFGIDYSFVLFKNIDTGRDYGLGGAPRIIPYIGTTAGEIDALNFYIFVLLMLFLAVGFIMFLAFSRYGLIFQAIREDEDAAESLGINVRFYKILTFVVSAFFAGIAGVLYAQQPNYSTGPSAFSTTISFSVIIMCVIGGIGSITGGIVGAFIMTLLLNIFLNDVFEADQFPALDILVFGLFVIVTLRYFRFGLVRADKDQKRAVVIGVLFTLSWAIINSFSLITLDSFQWDQTLDSWTKIYENEVFTFLALLLMLVFTLPAIPIFVISEYIGFLVFEDVLGMSFNSFNLPKAKFIIYLTVSIPYAYYLPKIFKKIRLRFWGVWPSVGRYEPD